MKNANDDGKRLTAKRLTVRPRGTRLAFAAALLLSLGATGCEEFIDLRPDKGVPNEAGADLLRPDQTVPDTGPGKGCPGLFGVEAKGKGGDLELAGEVDFGTVVLAKNALVSIYAVIGQKDGMQTFDFLGTKPLQEEATKVRYRITDLPQGSYTIYFKGDVTGDGKYETLDLGGYYPGSPTAPIQDGMKATPVTLGGASRCNLDFGVGVIP